MTASALGGSSDGRDLGLPSVAPTATWSWRVDSDRVAYSAGWHAIMGESHGDGVRSLHAWLGGGDGDVAGGGTRLRDRPLMATLDRHITGETPQFLCEHRVRTRNGAFRWVVASAVVERDVNGRPTVLAGTLVDVTERNTRDPLAGLPGVGALRAHVARLVQAARRQPDSRFALLLVDLDRFGAVNYQFGHDTGDGLLREALQRISRCLREGDLVARIGSKARRPTSPSRRSAGTSVSWCSRT